ncbi:MAG: ABC transporter ATP-binding protein [Spirochaetes bacterium]|nr:ABC transporter ATP-binding protein [Spirochaetota bacterium]
MDEKKRKPDLGLLRLVAPYLRAHKPLIAVSVFALLAGHFFSLSLPFLTRHAVDVDIKGGDPAGLGRTAFLFGGALLLGFAFTAGSNLGVSYLGQRLLYALRLDVLRKVFRLPSGYFDRTSTGTVLTHLTNDVEAVRQFVSEGLVTVAGDLILAAFVFAAMFAVNWRLALATAVSVPLFLLATALFRKAIRTGFRRVRAANSEINTALVESLGGHSVISLFRHRTPAIRHFDGRNREYLDAYRQVVDAYAAYFPVIEVVTHLSLALVLAVAHFRMGAAVKPGEVFALFALINMFFRPLRDLAENFNTFQSALAALERIDRLMGEPEPIADPPRPRLPGRAPGGEIRFERVSFSYLPGKPVLRDLSFSVRPGEKVAVVGATGAGKSTLAHLVPRLYDVDAGSVSVDGIDVREWPLAGLRERLAVVPQNVFLFTGSAADNIRLFAPEVGRQAVVEAARAVNAHGFIERLPKGYDENVLEEGMSLSTGQKQLLAFARAFVAKPSLLILDEATASIDSETEALIEKSLDRLLEGRTAILIAHRLSTIRRVDRILVLHQGRLVQEGSHEVLLKQDGLYRQLYEMQALALA